MSYASNIIYYLRHTKLLCVMAAGFVQIEQTKILRYSNSNTLNYGMNC